MSDSTGHQGHANHEGHKGHGSHHGHQSHSSPAEANAAYKKAFDEAVPFPSREVVSVTLVASEFDWEFSPGLKTRAWGLNGTVPGPTIEARVGDVLEITLTNKLSEPLDPVGRSGSGSVSTRPLGPSALPENTRIYIEGCVVTSPFFC